jgi:16S rRNA processing protein RimM
MTDSNSVVSSNSGLTWPADAVELGYISDAYGIKGWVKVQPHGEAQALLHAKTWWLKPTSRNNTVLNRATTHEQAVSVRQSRWHSGSVVANFKTCADRDQAENLRGMTVWVSRADFPPAEDGSYYWVDLIGLTVTNPKGIVLGTVTDLIDNNAHQVLRVVAQASSEEKNPPKEHLIPFVGAYVLDVDITNKQISVDWEHDY